MTELKRPGAVLIRPEHPGDYNETENLTREAFWNLMGPGCTEHYLLRIMRGDSSFIPELNYVAEWDDKIIGNIVYTKSLITTRGGTTLDIITFGPIGILPAYQKNGIGAQLIRYTLDLARQMGYTAVVILGHPGYYPKLGFKRGADYGLSLSDDQAPDALMALELIPGSLSELGGGIYHYAAVYNVDPAAAEVFDKRFPPKEKKATDTHL